MKQTRKSSLLVLMLFAISIIVSCQSQARPYNIEKTEMDEGSKVLIDSSLEIISVNGKPLSPAVNPFHKPIPMVFDPGTYTFRLRYYSKLAIFKTLTDYIDLECVFQAGKSYQVYSQFIDVDQIIIDYMEIELRDDELKLFR